jgi:hypothetical protein
MQEVTLTYVVTVQLRQEAGKFAPLEELAQEVQDALENADPSSVDVGEGDYTVDSWDVARQAQPKRVRSAQDKLAGRA